MRLFDVMLSFSKILLEFLHNSYFVIFKMQHAINHVKKLLNQKFVLYYMTYILNIYNFLRV